VRNRHVCIGPEVEDVPFEYFTRCGQILTRRKKKREHEN